MGGSFSFRRTWVNYIPAVTIAALTLAISALYSPVHPVKAKENSGVFTIKSKGHSRTILIETTDYDRDTNEESITETLGEELIGKFKVDSEYFQASIKNMETKESYDLVGTIEQVLAEDKAYYYKGVDDDSDLIKFEAIVEKTSPKDYEATINIYEYENKKSEKPISIKTYIFDGKGSTTKKYKQKSDRKTIKMRKSSVDNKNITTYDKREYYRTILATWGKGYRYEIQGPETTRIDGGNNYSFRWGTDKEYIESVLEAEGLNYTGQHDIVNFRLRLYTSEPIVFNTVVPCCESEKKFSVPMWFGNQIGVVNLPVTASKLDITGDGTDDILYDFKWNENYFPSGYLDERDFDDYPYNTPGFAVRYFMDTAPSIDTGVAKINFNGYFKYRSLVNKYSLLLHEYTEITHKNYYFIDIVE